MAAASLLAVLASTLPSLAAPSLDEKRQAAAAFLQCPQARWEVVEQPFWPHQMLFKLRSCAWPHRPTVAVDEQGTARLLTDTILLRFSEESVLKTFNAVARTEAVRITAGNAAAYLRFFLAAHLHGRDDIYFGDDTLGRRVEAVWRRADATERAEETRQLAAELEPLPLIAVTAAAGGRGFQATVLVWGVSWVEASMERYEITIHVDGTVDLAPAGIIGPERPR